MDGVAGDGKHLDATLRVQVVNEDLSHHREAQGSENEVTLL